MYEIVAIVVGVVIGLITQNTASTQLKAAMLLLGSALGGALVSSVSGEVFVSWAYLVFDAVQVLLVACATVVFLAVWRWRSTSD